MWILEAWMSHTSLSPSDTWSAHWNETILALPAPSHLTQQLILPGQQKYMSSTSKLLFSLCFWCSRGLRELWLQPSAVCAHTMSAPLKQPEHLIPDWQGRTRRDLPGDLSSITNPVAAKHSASCRLRPSKVRVDQSSTHSLMWHSLGAQHCLYFWGTHLTPALDNPKSAPALGYGEAISAELLRKKAGKEKGIQCSGQRRRKEQAMIRSETNWTPQFVAAEDLVWTDIPGIREFKRKAG